MSLDFFKKSLKDSIIIKKNNYPYIVHPLLDGIPEIKPEILDEVVVEMEKIINKYRPFNKIVTIEAMGLPITTALSLKTNIPFTVIRKRPYGLAGELVVEQKTGYSKSKLYINDIKKDDRIIIIDDVLSTGGTLRSVLSVFKKNYINVKGVIILVNKGRELNKLKDDFDIDINILSNIDIIDNEIIMK